MRVWWARIRAGLARSGGMEGVEVVGFGRVGLGSWKNGFRSETWNTVDGEVWWEVITCNLNMIKHDY